MVVISQRTETGVGKWGGNVSGLIALQQAIKKKLAMSPGESWPCCSLALSSPCVPCLLRCLLSDCHKASARPLSKTNPFPPSLPSLSLLLPVYLAMLDSRLQVFSFLFSASCSSELCRHAPAPCRAQKLPVGGRRRVL